MRYKLCIDQVRSIEWNLNLQEAVLFSYLFSASEWADQQDGFSYVSKKKIIQDIPILSQKRDTIYRLLKSLAKKGVIEYKNIDLVKVTDKGQQWHFIQPIEDLGKKSDPIEDLGKKSDPSEKNPSLPPETPLTSQKNPNNLGKKSEVTSEKNPSSISVLSDNNINNTIQGLVSDENTIIPPAEIRIMAAIEKTRAYFREWPYLVDRCKEASKNPNLTNKEIIEEIEKWIRYHGNEFYFLSNIEKNVSSSFLRWMGSPYRATEKKALKTPESSSFPSIYDKKFEDGLSPDMLPKYWQHLVSLGWKKTAYQGKAYWQKPNPPASITALATKMRI